jgi:uncharacterized membrane protein
MTGKLVTFLLWFCAIGSGLIAGVFFAFSTFIMRALARIEQSQGISAMQAINTTILGSLFMPVFFGTTFASLVLAGVALWGWGESGSLATFAASLIYVVGMFISTVAFNVPLNNALANVEASGAGAASLWARYLVEWTRWNHVRTVSSTIACVLFVYAIALR